MRLIIILPLIAFFQLIFPGDQDPIEKTCISVEEKKLYDIIMAYRKSRKLKIIPLSTKLTKVAQTHAHDLSDNYKMDPKNKCNPHSWSDKGKWSSCCYTSDHKKAKCMWDKPIEIARYASPGYEIAYYSSIGASPEESLEGWKHSPTHNPLIVNTGQWSKVEWRAIGVGIYKEHAIVWFGQLKDTMGSPANCSFESPN